MNLFTKKIWSGNKEKIKVLKNCNAKKTNKMSISLHLLRE